MREAAWATGTGDERGSEAVDADARAAVREEVVERERVAFEARARDEEHAGNAEPPQDRQCDLGNRSVSVIKGNQQRAARQPPRQNLVETDQLVVPRQLADVAFEDLRRCAYGESVDQRRGVVRDVVVEDSPEAWGRPAGGSRPSHRTPIKAKSVTFATNGRSDRCFRRWGATESIPTARYSVNADLSTQPARTLSRPGRPKRRRNRGALYRIGPVAGLRRSRIHRLRQCLGRRDRRDGRGICARGSAGQAQRQPTRHRRAREHESRAFSGPRQILPLDQRRRLA